VAPPPPKARSAPPRRTDLQANGNNPSDIPRSASDVSNVPKPAIYENSFITDDPHLGGHIGGGTTLHELQDEEEEERL